MADTNVRAVERAFDILDCFTPEKPRLSLSEIAKQVNLYPSTALRLLGTLVSHHYLYRDPLTLRYSIGFKLKEFGQIAPDSLDLAQASEPFLQKLHEQFNESVGLYVSEGDCRVCVARIESNHQLRNVIQIGDRRSYTKGASGRLLLAYKTEGEIKAILESTETPVTLEQIETVREMGYAISMGERDQGINSIAAPVFGVGGKMIASLFLTAPAFRIEVNSDYIIQQVIQCANELSLTLGYSK